MVLPLAHLPVPGMSNPVIVVKVEGVNINVYADFLPLEAEDRVNLQDIVREHVIRFKRGLEELLSRKFSLVCRGESDYDVLSYVAITNELLKQISGDLSEAELRIASAIDSRLGLPDYVSAVRFASLVPHHYAWRRAEPVVDLGNEIVVKLKSIRWIGKLGQPFLEVSKEALSHLVGRSALVLAKAIREGNVETLRRVLRFVDGLWYSVYGLPVPCGSDSSTYVPGLGGVYCVELEFSPRTS